MEVGGAVGGAREPELLSGLHELARDDIDLGQMRVVELDARRIEVET